MTSITIPNSVTSIGDDAFDGTAVYKNESNWESGVLYISNCLIAAQSNISGTCTIKDGTRLIGGFAFEGCSSLTSIIIPESVTHIGSDIVWACGGLTSVTWNAKNCSTSSYSSDSPFYWSNSSITSFTFGNTVERVPSYLCYGMKKLTSMNLPNSVTSIGDAAFYGCSGLTSITIPNSVTSIGEEAFRSCSSLTSITIPNSVTSIGGSAFEGCSSLTKTNYTGDIAGWCNIMFGDNYANPMYYSHNFFINDQEIKDLVIPNSVTSIGEYAFSWCSSLTSVTIPESVTSIGEGVFWRCSSLTSITIPNSVTSIGDWAFGDCSSLTSITIPNSVTSIGEYAFYRCSSLTSVTIPNSVTSIGGAAFYDCSSLTSITIPNSVTSIGDWAFGDCSSLTSITCEAITPPTIGEDAFYGVSSSTPVYVPCGRVDAYKAAEDWKDFTNIQEPLAEYSIEISTSNNQMGSAKVDYNTFCEGNQISAIANYGYHFVQWSDGNTDNPRSLTLTQDTILTAEFAINTYEVTIVAENGATSGAGTYNHGTTITLTATPNEGYHFVEWSDGSTDNPRTIVVTEDINLTAEFAINTYTLTTKSNGNGNVTGNGTYKHGENVIISATADIGYHFVRWSDGVIDNPRTVVLTQDTTFSAEFAQSFSGQCGDNLYWAYNESDQGIAITGTGDMYNYTSGTQPWILFLEKIKKVTTDNTAASLGTSAFEGAIRLAEVHIGAKIDMIEANVFAGCDRLRNIYCYPTYPPIIRESSFARYDALLYIPCDYLDDYVFDNNWKRFENIQCAGAEKEEIESDGVDVDPSSTSVTMTWPTEENANTYTIEIMKDGALFCRLVFNTAGQLLNISFAPSRDGNNRPAQYAELVANGSGLRFTVTGLNERTHYTYDLRAKDKDENTIQSHSGEFTTKSNVTTDMDNIQSPVTTCQKVMRNGQLIIIRDGVEYNAMGQEIH